MFLNLITGSQGEICPVSGILKKEKEREERSWPKNPLKILLENNFLEFMLGIVIIDSNLMNRADFLNNSLFYFFNEGNWVRFS